MCVTTGVKRPPRGPPSYKPLLDCQTSSTNTDWHPLAYPAFNRAHSASVRRPQPGNSQLSDRAATSETAVSKLRSTELRSLSSGVERCDKASNHQPWIALQLLALHALECHRFTLPVRPYEGLVIIASIILQLWCLLAWVRQTLQRRQRWPVPYSAYGRPVLSNVLRHGRVYG